MSKKIVIEIKDSKNIKNILIQVDVKHGATFVLSNFSTWENLALVMEALALTIEKCIEEGIARKKVEDAVRNYLVEVLGSYKIIKRVSD